MEETRHTDHHKADARPHPLEEPDPGPPTGPGNKTGFGAPELASFEEPDPGPPGGPGGKTSGYGIPELASFDEPDPGPPTGPGGKTSGFAAGDSDQ